MLKGHKISDWGVQTEISRAGNETGIFLLVFSSNKFFGIFIIFGNVPTCNTVKKIFELELRSLMHKIAKIND